MRLQSQPDALDDASNAGVMGRGQGAGFKSRKKNEKYEQKTQNHWNFPYTSFSASILKERAGSVTRNG